MADLTDRDDDEREWLQKVDAGTTLFSQGDSDCRLFVLIDGQVEILRDGKVLAEIGVAESFIGEVSALTGRPRSATARTSRSSTLLVVEHIEDLFQQTGNWGIRLARELANRLDRMNDRFSRLQEVLDLTRTEGGDGDHHTQTLEAIASVGAEVGRVL